MTTRDELREMVTILVAEAMAILKASEAERSEMPLTPVPTTVSATDDLIELVSRLHINIAALHSMAEFVKSHGVQRISDGQFVTEYYYRDVRKQIQQVEDLLNRI